MVLIVVALSFDILWYTEKIPIIEIAVFIFVLMIWAYGNLKGGIWEYPLKLGSFNLATTLLTNFYFVTMLTNSGIDMLWAFIIGSVILPILCFIISLSLYKYLKETADREISLGILIGGTLGYVMSTVLLFLLG